MISQELGNLLNGEQILFRISRKELTDNKEEFTDHYESALWQCLQRLSRLSDV